MLQKRKHQACRTGNQRRERPETVFARLFGMRDATRVRFGIEAVTKHINLIIGFLPVHLRIYPIARSIREYFEEPIEPALFGTGQGLPTGF